jgi:hypothetical protein
MHMRVWCTCAHIKSWSSIPHLTSHDNFINNPSRSSPPVAMYFYNNPLPHSFVTSAVATLLCAPPWREGTSRKSFAPNLYRKKSFTLSLMETTLANRAFLVAHLVNSLCQVVLHDQASFKRKLICVLLVCKICAFFTSESTCMLTHDASFGSFAAVK